MLTAGLLTFGRMLRFPQPSFAARLQTSLLPWRAAGSPTPTFTRATTAYVLGYAAGAVIADGPTLIACASGEARFMGARRVSEGVWSAVDANGVALTTTNGASSACCDASGPFGYLAEGARTNLCLHSQALDNAAWTPNNLTVGANNVVAPDGTTTAETLTSSGVSTNIYQSVTITTAAHTWSVYVKKGTADFLWMDAYDGANRRTWFNLTTATVATNTAGNTATITSLPSGWLRATVSRTAGATTGFAVVGMSDADNSSDAAVGKTMVVWGMQLEAASFASTYIPTTTAAVTRNADVLTYVAAGNANAVAGSSYAEVTMPNQSAVAMYLVDLGNNRPSLYVTSSSGLKLSIYDGATESVDSAITPSLTTAQKVASSYGGAVMKTFVGGAAGTGAVFDGSMNVGTNISVGAQNGSGLQPYGTIRNVRIFGTALSDAQLTAMTA